VRELQVAVARMSAVGLRNSDDGTIRLTLADCGRRAFRTDHSLTHAGNSHSYRTQPSAYHKLPRSKSPKCQSCYTRDSPAVN
jgi:hypothetical protein